jgi:outer membrane protein assembly factor BamB
VDVRAALRAGALLVGKGDRSGTAYVGAADGRVHAIDLAPRLDRVVIEAAAAIEGAPVVVGDRVCALSSDGRVHSMDLSTGRRRVLLQMDGAATGTLSVASGTIFATDTASYVYAIDARTGRKNWQLHTDGLVLSAPLPDAVWLYIGGTDGTLREIGIADPSQHRMTEVGAPVHVAPVRGGNLLYVGSCDGVVHAYDIGHRGSAALDEAWHVDLGEEIAGLAASGGRVYVATGYRLMEVDSDKRPPRELLRMDCLIGAPPVISGRHCYVAGLGGVVSCLALN